MNERNETALATTKEMGIAKREVFTLTPSTLTEAIEFSRLIAASELCPKEFRQKPQDILIAVQMGAELGVSPMQALQNIAVINGRPTMWGDLLIGLVKASGILERIEERDPQECWSKKEGRCAVLRKGQTVPTVRTYSYAMAEQAGLTKRAGPSGPWTTHPGRMLQMRARAWALRDEFPDVLRGIQAREEVEDYPQEPEPIRMPRRASEADSQEVEAFLEEISPAPRQTPENGPSTTTPAGNIWTGQVKVTGTKSGKKQDGTPWTGHFLESQDGTKFVTFSQTDAEFARNAGALPVRIQFEETPKGKRALSIEPASAEREPGEEPDF